MVFDGLFVVRLKADGFSSQVIKSCLLTPITFCLSINLLEKRSVCLCSHLLQAKSAIIFSSIVLAAEASLAHLTWSRMVGRIFLQTALLAGFWRGPEVSSGVTRASLLGWLEVGKGLAVLDQCSTLQARRVEGHHVWVMFVSQTSELLRERPFDTILGTKKPTACLSPGPWIIPAACW